jgi:hypothetical protein
MSSKSETVLRSIIDAQGGFFTYKQALQSGYTKNEVQENLVARKWIEEFEGVLRLLRYPFGFRADLIPYHLWLKQRYEEDAIVFSHHSAFEVYEYLDLLPMLIHLTVEKRVVPLNRVPYGLKIHYAELPPSDIQHLGWLPITTPVRTFIDIILEKRLPFDVIQEAYVRACNADQIKSLEDLLNHPLAQNDPALTKAIKEL